MYVCISAIAIQRATIFGITITIGVYTGWRTVKGIGILGINAVITVIIYAISTVLLSAGIDLRIVVVTVCSCSIITGRITRIAVTVTVIIGTARSC